MSVFRHGIRVRREENVMDTSENISAEFPFELAYVSVLGSKMAYVDEGQGDPILFLHGNPTSSYLWRNVIPYLCSMGRCIAPDLFALGPSVRPTVEYRRVNPVPSAGAFLEILAL